MHECDADSMLISHSSHFSLLLVILFTHGCYFRNPIRAFCNLWAVVRVSVFLGRQLTGHTFPCLCTCGHTIEPSTPLSNSTTQKDLSLFSQSLWISISILFFDASSQCIMYDNSLIQTIEIN